jgi:excinuclease ABC subunit B
VFDVETKSIRTALDETQRRRKIQQAYNEEHGITPTTIIKEIDGVIGRVYEGDYVTVSRVQDDQESFRSQAELDGKLAKLQAEMQAAAANLEFERAAQIRDRIKKLQVPGAGIVVHSDTF